MNNNNPHILDIDPQYQLSDALWAKIFPLLPPQNTHKIKSGRPRMDDRLAMNAIFYLLRTGSQWASLPRSLGARSTVHDRFQSWIQAGLFLKLWQAALIEYDSVKHIDWEWQSMDGCHVLSPLAGQDTGPSFKHHGKTGTNRSLLTEGHGIPIGLVIASANTNDLKLAEPTLLSIPIPRPQPTPDHPQNLCLDKGYDYSEVFQLLNASAYTPHISRKGAQPIIPETIPKYRSHRWVVERTHSWMNKFRRLLIRWEKKSQNYLALLHFVCAFIIFRAASIS